MKIIDVMMKFDENRVNHAATVIYSASKNLNKDYKLRIHIIYPELSDNSKSKLLGLKKLVNNIESVNLYRFNDYYDVSNYKISRKWSECILYPLFESEILPEYVTKTIHLDEDIIVLDSLHKLIELSGNTPYSAVAEVVPNNIFKYSIPIDINAVIPNFDYHKYTNCGVCVMDLSYVREHNILSKYLYYLNRIEEYKLIWVEQSIFNIVYSDCINLIPLRWNYAAFYEFKCDVRDDAKIYKDYGGEFIDDPAIIHYAGWQKPWVLDNKLSDKLRSKWTIYNDELSNIDNNYKVEYEYFDTNKLSTWVEFDTKEKLLNYYKL